MQQGQRLITLKSSSVIGAQHENSSEHYYVLKASALCNDW